MSLGTKYVLLDKMPQPFLERSRLDAIVDQVSLFGGLDEEQLTSLIQKLKYTVFTNKEFIFRRGEGASYIYIVLSGTVKLLFSSPDHPMVGQQYTQGECFGVTSVIGIQNHSVTTQADGEVQLLVLSRDDLMSIFEEDQALFASLILNIARESCRRLNHLNNCFEKNSIDTISAQA